jgi:hypothetical protein
MFSVVETARITPSDATQPDVMIVRRELPELLTAAGADKGHVD